MDPNTPTLEQQPQITQWKKFLNKKTIIIGIIITIILLSIFLFFLQNGKGARNNLPLVTAPTPVPSIFQPRLFTQDEVQNALDETTIYITTQNTGSSTYDFVYDPETTCAIPDNCPFNPDDFSKISNSWVALANFSHYEVFEDELSLIIMNRSVAELDTWCAQDRKKCNWVLVQPEIIYQKTKDSKTLDFLQKQTDILLSSSPSENLMLLAIEARELMLMGEITGNSAYTTEGLKRLQSALVIQQNQENIYASTADVQLPQFACWVSLAQIEASKSDEKELNSIGSVLDSKKMIENFTSFTNPIEIQPCIESYYNLYTYTQKSEYLRFADGLLNNMLSAFWDSEADPITYGKNGTSYNARYAEKNQKIVNITDTSYTAYLLGLSNKFNQ